MNLVDARLPGPEGRHKVAQGASPGEKPPSPPLIPLPPRGGGGGKGVEAGR